VIFEMKTQFLSLLRLPSTSGRNNSPRKTGSEAGMFHPVRNQSRKQMDPNFFLNRNAEATQRLAACTACSLRGSGGWRETGSETVTSHSSEKSLRTWRIPAVQLAPPRRSLAGCTSKIPHGGAVLGCILLSFLQTYSLISKVYPTTRDTVAGLRER
jgi:hypothetical protein